MPNEHGDGEPLLPTTENPSNPIENPSNPVETAESNKIPNPTPVQTNKRKYTSEMWNHFKRQNINGQWKAVCNYCSRKLGGETRNGTKHLHDHYERCPNRNQGDIRQSLLKTSRSSDGSVTVNTYTFDQANARNALVRMIILHEYPISMVEHHGFKEYSITLQPLFKVVSRNTVKSDVLKMYDVERSKTMELILMIKSRVAITTGMSTSSNKNRGFMAVTAHFVDKSWNLQSRILRFIYVPAPHTVEVLSETVMDCLFDWNIDRRVSTVTLDNCSTNDFMVGSILDKLDHKSLMLSGKLLHMRCSAHILNLIVKDGLDVIGDGIERVRDSVAYCTASAKREELFEKIASQLEIPCSKKIALDCKIRWNSTYLMFHTALSYKEVFYRLSSRDSHYKCHPNERDWLLAKDVCDRLEIFYEVTELFSGTKYPTTNLFFPKICEIKSSICDWGTFEFIEVSLMADNMMSEFDKY